MAHEYCAAKLAKANFSQKQMDLAINVAQVAVQAVEQLAANGQFEYKEKLEAHL
jgi:hypothetical protein